MIGQSLAASLGICNIRAGLNHGSEKKPYQTGHRLEKAILETISLLSSTTLGLSRRLSEAFDMK